MFICVTGVHEVGAGVDDSAFNENTKIWGVVVAAPAKGSKLALAVSLN